MQGPAVLEFHKLSLQRALWLTFDLDPCLIRMPWPVLWHSMVLPEFAVIASRAGYFSGGIHPAAGLEAIKFSGHDWVHDNKGNLSANCICGFDKWYDNHYGIDGGMYSFDEYKVAFDQWDWAYYHVWGRSRCPTSCSAHVRRGPHR